MMPGKTDFKILWVPGGAETSLLCGQIFFKVTKNHYLYYVLCQGSGVSKEKTKTKQNKKAWMACSPVSRPINIGIVLKFSRGQNSPEIIVKKQNLVSTALNTRVFPHKVTVFDYFIQRNFLNTR